MILQIPAQRVPREYDYIEHWPYSDRVIQPAPPTIIERTIGQELIDALTIMGTEWEVVLRPDFKMPHEWSTLLPGAPDEESSGDNTLEDLYLQAKLEESRYFDEYGEIDADWLVEGQPVFRRARIGDQVQWLRRSTDELDLMYGEPVEDRPSMPLHYRKTLNEHGSPSHSITSWPDVPFDPSRWDGDGRFGAQDTEIWGESAYGIYVIDLTDPEQRKNFYNR